MKFSSDVLPFFAGLLWNPVLSIGDFFCIFCVYVCLDWIIRKVMGSIKWCLVKKQNTQKSFISLFQYSRLCNMCENIIFPRFVIMIGIVISKLNIIIKQIFTSVLIPGTPPSQDLKQGDWQIKKKNEWFKISLMYNKCYVNNDLLFPFSWKCNSKGRQHHFPWQIRNIWAWKN